MSDERYAHSAVIDETFRTEPCGCRWRISNGALLRGCRRHDPEIAGRIVKALEDVIVSLWSLKKSVVVMMRQGVEVPNEQGAPMDLVAWDAQLRHELRMLLRIRGVGKGRR